MNKMFFIKFIKKYLPPLDAFLASMFGKYFMSNSALLSFYSLGNILFIAFVTFVTLIFPKSFIYFVVPIMALSIPIGFTSWINSYFALKINIIRPILELLNTLGILRSLMKLHTLVFYSEKGFYWFFVLFCHGLTIIYTLTSRYNFYHVIILKEHFTGEITLWLAFLLFIGFFGSYLRVLISFSNLVVVVARYHLPELLDPLLRVEPEDFPPGSNRSIFSFSKHNHNHNYPPKAKITTWGKFGIVVATGSLVVGGLGLYYLGRQTTLMEESLFEARKANLELERQNFEMGRQNDLSEVSAGIRSMESYKTKYPLEN